MRVSLLLKFLLEKGQREKWFARLKRSVAFCSDEFGSVLHLFHSFCLHK